MTSPSRGIPVGTPPRSGTGGLEFRRRGSLLGVVIKVFVLAYCSRSSRRGLEGRWCLAVFPRRSAGPTDRCTNITNFYALDGTHTRRDAAAEAMLHWFHGVALGCIFAIIYGDPGLVLEVRRRTTSDGEIQGSRPEAITPGCGATRCCGCHDHRAGAGALLDGAVYRAVFAFQRQRSTSSKRQFARFVVLQGFILFTRGVRAGSPWWWTSATASRPRLRTR